MTEGLTTIQEKGLQQIVKVAAVQGLLQAKIEPATQEYDLKVKKLVTLLLAILRR